MLGRPPREWFQRCETEVEASGSAVDPAAVCGAVWARKGEQERRAITRMEEGMATKRKKKKATHAKKGHRTSRRAAKKTRPRHAKTGTHRKTQRAPARHARTKKHHHRCAMCGHSAQHVARQGCLHFDGKRFCSCKQRG
jgi:hypothetical protein